MFLIIRMAEGGLFPRQFGPQQHRPDRSRSGHLPALSCHTTTWLEAWTTGRHGRGTGCTSALGCCEKRSEGKEGGRKCSCSLSLTLPLCSLAASLLLLPDLLTVGGGESLRAFCNWHVLRVLLHHWLDLVGLLGISPSSYGRVRDHHSLFVAIHLPASDMLSFPHRLWWLLLLVSGTHIGVIYAYQFNFIQVNTPSYVAKLLGASAF